MSSSSPARTALPGSESHPPPGARIIGPVEASQPIEVSVLVRPRQPLEGLEARLGEPQRYLSREEFAAAYGVDPTDLARIADFARVHGLEVVESSAARRTVRLSGSAADVSAAFGVELMRYRLPDGSTFRGYSGAISI